MLPCCGLSTRQTRAVCQGLQVPAWLPAPLPGACGEAGCWYLPPSGCTCLPRPIPHSLQTLLQALWIPLPSSLCQLLLLPPRQEWRRSKCQTGLWLPGPTRQHPVLTPRDASLPRPGRAQASQAQQWGDFPGQGRRHLSNPVLETASAQPWEGATAPLPQTTLCPGSGGPPRPAARPHRGRPTSPPKFAPALGPAVGRRGLRTEGGKEAGERRRDRGTGPGSRRGRERASQASEGASAGAPARAHNGPGRGGDAGGGGDPGVPQPPAGPRATARPPSPPSQSSPHGATPRGFLPRRRGRSGSRLRAPAVGGRRGSERGRGRGGRGPGREAHGARAPLARPPGARPLRHICSSGREGGRGGRAVRGCLREGGRREEGGGGRRARQASEEGEEEGRGGRPCSLLPPPLVPSRPPSQQTPLAAAAPGPGRQLPGGACASGGGGGREPALGRGRGGSEGGGAARRGYPEGGGAGPRLSGARPPRPHPRVHPLPPRPRPRPEGSAGTRPGGGPGVAGAGVGGERDVPPLGKPGEGAGAPTTGGRACGPRGKAPKTGKMEEVAAAEGAGAPRLPPAGSPWPGPPRPRAPGRAAGMPLRRP